MMPPKPGSRPSVLLVTPPYHSGVVESAGTWIPLGLLYLGGVLRRAGFGAVLYDAMSLFHTHEQVRETLRRERPDALFVSCITATVLDGIEVCRTAKEELPQVLTVLGNTHPTFMADEMLADPAVDIVVRGEGEETAVELLQAWAGGGEYDRVPGLSFRKDGKVENTPPRPFLQDLDPLEPAWDLVDWKRYTYRPRPGSTLAVVSSARGCKQHCSFCSQRLFWQESWRAVSPKRFLDQLEGLRRDHGVDVAMLADEIPSLDRDRWTAILDGLIERDLGITLLLETRVDDILRDADLLPRYRRAGIEHIYVGVEAVNQATLDLFKKDAKVEQGKQAIELINGHDMISETSFVMGMPNETREEMERTIELAKYYDPDMAFFLAITPWPYADLYAEVKNHIAVTDYRKYNLVEPVIKPETMTLDEVKALLLRGFQEFYTAKMARHHLLPPWKRDFMRSLMQLLMTHSYLKDQLTQFMPAHARKLMGMAE